MVFDHVFEPSGYTICDKCKICGQWCLTWEGLQDSARQIYLSGNTGGVAFEAYVKDRELAIAHGISSPSGDRITKDNFPLARLVSETAKRKKRIQELSSDISIDSDVANQKETSDSIKTTAQQIEIQDTTSLEIGDIVFYGKKPKASPVSRKPGILVDKNAIMKMVKVQDIKTRREEWMKFNRVWINVSVIAESRFDQLGIWQGDPNFSEIEALVPYVGMH